MAEHTRTLGFKIAFALGLGTMIAAGIFSLSGVAVASVGSSAVVSFVIAATIAGITAASYSEFASIYSKNGGGYLFSSQTFEERELLVYFIGASLFLGYTGTTAFYLATMDEWFFRFIIPSQLPLPHGTVGILAAVLLGALNAKGTEESGTFQLVVTAAKVGVLLIFVAGIVGFVGPAKSAGQFASGFESAPVDILYIASLAFITFFGFSAIAASAGEIIEPRKTVPTAIAASILTVTVLYTLVIVAMVNSPVPAEVIAEEGETAMGRVASAALGPVGFWLIVAGAIFSMVSASNASILAATGIGSLMGRQGQAPRRFSRIHPKFGTPFWSVIAVTGTIVALILLFIAVFPAHGPALGGLHLGLTALTGFATLNLLVPLSLVNIALIYSRRRFPDIERGFRVPGVPVVPVVGVLANLALIYNLPTDGVISGVVIIGLLIGTYLAWGGAPDIEELYERVVPASESVNPASSEEAVGAKSDGERFRILVPVARPDKAPTHVQMAARIGATQADNPVVQVVNTTEIPEQTPNEIVEETAGGRVDRLKEALAGVEIDAEHTVEGHISRDVAFDITHTAREDGADLILMGYPVERADITEAVEYNSPCDVIYAQGIDEGERFDTVTVGVGGGPHQRALLPLIRGFGERGSTVYLVNVTPTKGGGTAETADETAVALEGVEDLHTRSVTADTVADGLVDAAAEAGGVLIVGASRDRRLRRWVFGSTPDRVVERAQAAGVPVLVYAGAIGGADRLEDYLFPVYKLFRQFRGHSSFSRDEQRSEGQIQ